MIGAIIRDIVGSRFEFNNYLGTDFELFHPESQYADDTICTMAMADCIVNVNEWGPEADSIIVKRPIAYSLTSSE